MTRLTTQMVGDWLSPQLDYRLGFHVAIFLGRQEEMPDRSLTITQSGAAREQYEGDFEQVPFQFLSRGREEDIADAETIAQVADDIVFDTRNQDVGPVYVTSAWAVNSPTQMSMTDQQSRYQFTANYLFLASRFN